MWLLSSVSPLLEFPRVGDDNVARVGSHGSIKATSCRRLAQSQNMSASTDTPSTGNPICPWPISREDDSHGSSWASTDPKELPSQPLGSHAGQCPHRDAPVVLLSGAWAANLLLVSLQLSLYFRILWCIETPRLPVMHTLRLGLKQLHTKKSHQAQPHALGPCVILTKENGENGVGKGQIGVANAITQIFLVLTSAPDPVSRCQKAGLRARGLALRDANEALIPAST